MNKPLGLPRSTEVCAGTHRGSVGRTNAVQSRKLLIAALGGMLALVVAPVTVAQNPAANGVDDVPIKGAVDHYDGEDHSRKPETPQQAEIKKKYSPYAGRKYPTRVYFGDTHNHTANSGDAFMAGDRLTPEQAYRFARGEEVISSTGVPAKLSRPLDFLVVSDHAEGLGVMLQVYEGNPAFASDADARALGQGDEGRRQGSGHDDAGTHLRTGEQHAAGADQGPEGRRADHEVGLAAVHRHRRQVQRTGPLHRDDRLRVDLGAGRQQPAPQRAVPRRQGQGRPDPAVLGLAERGPGEALGVDGHSTSRRPAAGCWRSRTTPTCPTAACSSRSTSPASR